MVMGSECVLNAVISCWKTESVPVSRPAFPACGMGLSYMLDTLPFTDVFRKVLEGSGECAEKGWEFLHLSIAGWTLVFFVAMIAASFALIRRDP